MKTPPTHTHTSVRFRSSRCIQWKWCSVSNDFCIQVYAQSSRCIALSGKILEHNTVWCTLFVTDESKDLWTVRYHRLRWRDAKDTTPFTPIVIVRRVPFTLSRQKKNDTLAPCWKRKDTLVTITSQVGNVVSFRKPNQNFMITYRQKNNNKPHNWYSILQQIKTVTIIYCQKKITNQVNSILYERKSRQLW